MTRCIFWYVLNFVWSMGDCPIERDNGSFYLKTNPFAKIMKITVFANEAKGCCFK